jgi:prolyl 4-hydroxylase
MNGYRAVDARNLKWLRQRMDLACDMNEPLESLRKVGYSDEAIYEAIEKVRPRGNALLDVQGPPPLIRRNPPNLRKIDTDKFDGYTLDNFLSAKECSKLISLISYHLRPSTLGHGYSGDSFRTSTTADLCHLQAPAALAIDAKICKTLGIRAEYSEGISAQRYDVGQQFKPHWDYFTPGTDLYNRAAGVRGNRTWTFMVYLNDGMEGGATNFTRIKYPVAPKLGMALFWNNLLPDGSPNQETMHAGEPVTSGHKIIITKWFRVHGDGPVYHE